LSALNPFPYYSALIIYPPEWIPVILSFVENSSTKLNHYCRVSSARTGYVLNGINASPPPKKKKKKKIKNFLKKKFKKKKKNFLQKKNFFLK